MRTMAVVADELAQYMRGIVKPEVLPCIDDLALHLCFATEPVANRMNVEIPGTYTKDGNTVVASFATYDVYRADSPRQSSGAETKMVNRPNRNRSPYTVKIFGSSLKQAPQYEFPTITGARRWVESYGATADICTITDNKGRVVAERRRNTSDYGMDWFKASI